MAVGDNHIETFLFDVASGNVTGSASTGFTMTGPTYQQDPAGIGRDGITFDGVADYATITGGSANNPIGVTGDGADQDFQDCTYRVVFTIDALEASAAGVAGYVLNDMEGTAGGNLHILGYSGSSHSTNPDEWVANYNNPAANTFGGGVSTGVLYHAVVTMDASNMKTYINGNSVTMTSAVGAQTPSATARWRQSSSSAHRPPRPARRAIYARPHRP